MLNSKSICALVTVLGLSLAHAITPAYAGDEVGYTIADLELSSAGDLVDVCTVHTSHDHHEAAMGFCYGFFEGAVQFNEAITEPGRDDLICPPDGTTRAEAVDVVITYLEGNRQYRNESPVDATFRALIDTWPCP